MKAKDIVSQIPPTEQEFAFVLEFMPGVNLAAYDRLMNEATGEDKVNLQEPRELTLAAWRNPELFEALAARMFHLAMHYEMTPLARHGHAMRKGAAKGAKKLGERNHANRKLTASPEELLQRFQTETGSTWPDKSAAPIPRHIRDAAIKRLAAELKVCEQTINRALRELSP